MTTTVKVSIPAWYSDLLTELKKKNEKRIRISILLSEDISENIGILEKRVKSGKPSNNVTTYAEKEIKYADVEISMSEVNIMKRAQSIDWEAHGGKRPLAYYCRDLIDKGVSKRKKELTSILKNEAGDLLKKVDKINKIK